MRPLQHLQSVSERLLCCDSVDEPRDTIAAGILSTPVAKTTIDDVSTRSSAEVAEMLTLEEYPCGARPAHRAEIDAGRRFLENLEAISRVQDLPGAFVVSIHASNLVEVDIRRVWLDILLRTLHGELKNPSANSGQSLRIRRGGPLSREECFVTT